MKVKRFMSAVLLTMGLTAPAPSIAGRNSGNYRDGQTAAKAFCRPIESLAFEIAGAGWPKPGDYDRAALQVGSKVEAVYGEPFGQYNRSIPADKRRALRGGFEAGVKDCKRIIDQ